MKAISVDTLEDKFVDNLSVEFLAKEAAFDNDIKIIGKELKKSWWTHNKDRFIPNTEQ